MSLLAMQSHMMSSRGFCHSVLDLLGKVENQPSLADLADAIKQIDQNHQDNIGGCKSWNEIP
jgi:hypothetical protein